MGKYNLIMQVLRIVVFELVSVRYSGCNVVTGKSR